MAVESGQVAEGDLQEEIDFTALTEVGHLGSLCNPCPPKAQHAGRGRGVIAWHGSGKIGRCPLCDSHCSEHVDYYILLLYSL